MAVDARELEHALAVLLRPLRVSRKDPAWLQQVSEELHVAFGKAFGEEEAIHVQVGADGLLHEGKRLVDYSPREDPMVFRLFQHGVRQISIFNLVTQEDLREMVELLTADLEAEENREDDFGTLLVSREIPSIQFLVVETFSEDAGDADVRGGRQGSVAKILAEAVRETISMDPDAGHGGGGGAVRFWEADVKFFQGRELPELMAALPRVSVAESGGSALDDPEMKAFAGELRAALDRPVPFLTRPVLALMDVAEEADRKRLASLLAIEVIAEIEREGLGAAGGIVARLASWLVRFAGTPAAQVIAGELLIRPVWIAAFRALETEGRDIALDLLTVMPAGVMGKALRDATLQEPEAREIALAALLKDGARGLEDAREMFVKLDGEIALAVLRHLRGAGSDPAGISMHREALAHSDVRVRVAALAWFSARGGDHAVGVLGDALRDRSPGVRAAGLFFLVRTRARLAHGILKVWLSSEEIEAIPFEEKKRVAMILGSLGGDIRDHLRDLAAERNILRRQKLDERKAAAVAALGFLADVESAGMIKKIAESGSTGETLGMVCQQVLAALARGKPAYDEPLPALAEQVRAIGWNQEGPRPSLVSPAPMRTSAPPQRMSAPAPAVEVAKLPEVPELQLPKLPTLRPARTAPPVHVEAFAEAHMPASDSILEAVEEPRMELEVIGPADEAPMELEVIGPADEAPMELEVIGPADEEEKPAGDAEGLGDFAFDDLGKP